MKKYKLSLFVLALFITLLGSGFNPSVSKADWDDLLLAKIGCLSLSTTMAIEDTSAEVSKLQSFLHAGYFFNRDSSELPGYFGAQTKSAVQMFQDQSGLVSDGVVGKATRTAIRDVTCNQPGTQLPAGCTSTRGYSPTTGVKCDTVTVIDSSLPAGCTSTRGYSSTTGVKCDSAGKTFPVGCTSNSVYSVTTGQRCDGVSNPSSPIISGVSGPQSLNVNQQGKWTVTASDDRNRGNLSYQVSWGDEGYQTASGLYALRPTQQSAIFHHTYSQAGTYTPRFIVTNEKGQTAQTSLSVNVERGANLPAGCTSTSGYSSTTGERCDGTTPVAPVYPSTKISWYGGKNKVNVGLIDSRYDSEKVVLGWISLNANTSSSVTWSGQKVTDLSGGVSWNVSNLSSGPFRIIAVSEDGNGNYCITSPDTRCNVSISESFNISNLPQSISLPPLLTPLPTVQPSITVLSPNGGEAWQVGSTQTIRWSLKGNPYPLTCIYLKSLDSGAEYYGLVNNCLPSTTTSYKWTVDLSDFPASASGYKILVQNNGRYEDDPGVKDYSDSSFTITSFDSRPFFPAGCTSTSGYSSTTGERCDDTTPVTPSITVTSPNGGENFTLGASIPVTWTQTFDSDLTKVSVSNSTDTLYTSAVIQSTSGTNRFTLPVTAFPTAGSYRINTCSLLGTINYCDPSNAYFTITESLIIRD